MVIISRADLEPYKPVGTSPLLAAWWGGKELFSRQVLAWFYLNLIKSLSQAGRQIPTTASERGS